MTVDKVAVKEISRASHGVFSFSVMNSPTDLSHQHRMPESTLTTLVETDGLSQVTLQKSID